MAIKSYLNKKYFGDCNEVFKYIENEEVTFKVFIRFSPLLDSNWKQVEVTYFFEPMETFSDEEKILWYNSRIENLVREAFDRCNNENLLLPVKDTWMLLESERYKVKVDLELSVSCDFS